MINKDVIKEWACFIFLVLFYYGIGISLFIGFLLLLRWMDYKEAN